jgi:hypothetical protein
MTLVTNYSRVEDAWHRGQSNHGRYAIGPTQGPRSRRPGPPIVPFHLGSAARFGNGNCRASEPHARRDAPILSPEVDVLFTQILEDGLSPRFFPFRVKRYTAAASRCQSHQPTMPYRSVNASSNNFRGNSTKSPTTAADPQIAHCPHRHPNQCPISQRRLPL